MALPERFDHNVNCIGDEVVDNHYLVRVTLRALADEVRSLSTKLDALKEQVASDAEDLDTAYDALLDTGARVTITIQ